MSTQNLKTVKLIMVTSNNNNKFYEMKENGDGTFTVNYGRVGGRSTTQTYNMREWNKKYNEKVRKGYKDQTHLFVEDEEEIELEDVKDSVVQSLINSLMQYAKKSISKNYTVSADQVTKKQVEEAQRLLDALVGEVKKGMKLQEFNKTLLDLYQVIPRKMKNVNDHLIKQATTDDDIKYIETELAEEQATLDVMRGQVDINEKKKAASKEKIEKEEKLNILQTMGLEVEQVNDNDTIKQIKDLMQEHSKRFHKAFKVINHKSQKAYDNWLEGKDNKKEELFWHGSRNENWLSILETGLVLRPANAVISGKMFGDGLYFDD